MSSKIAAKILRDAQSERISGSTATVTEVRWVMQGNEPRFAVVVTGRPDELLLNRIMSLDRVDRVLHATTADVVRKSRDLLKRQNSAATVVDCFCVGSGLVVVLNTPALMDYATLGLLRDALQRIDGVGSVMTEPGHTPVTPVDAWISAQGVTSGV